MKKRFIGAGIFLLLFILLIVGIKTIDIAAIGPVGTEIGFASLNGGFHDLFGEWTLLDTLTDVGLVSAFVVVLIFAVTGLVQLVQRKSLGKIDREILSLGGLYLLTVVVFLFFEFVIVNYRPILEEGQTFPEASFPSTHVLLCVVILGSAFLAVGRFLRKGPFRTILRILLAFDLVFSVVGRAIAGVHWLTDILGGLLIGLSLVFLFWGMLEMSRLQEEKADTEQEKKLARRRVL